MRVKNIYLDRQGSTQNIKEGFEKLFAQLGRAGS